MKFYIIVLLVIILPNSLKSQNILQPADLEIPILLYDNSSTTNNSRILIFGLDSIATDGIDESLGEYDIFCPFDNMLNEDCPPVDMFFAIFLLPANNFNGTLKSVKDFRNGELPFSGSKEYRIGYQIHSTGITLNIDWNFPTGVTAILQDIFGGIFFSVQLVDSGSYSIPTPYASQVNKVKLIINYNNFIPIELTSFAAEISRTSVNLSWQTATETNNQGFEIQRKQICSKQTSNGNEEWKNIGYVNGAGTTTAAQSYSFVDSVITSGKYLYRLKQIDFNGTFEYSNTIEIEIYSPTKFTLDQNYPNPFNPSTKISWQSLVSSWQTLKIFDVLGNEVATLVNEYRNAGKYDVDFNANRLSSGVYYYQLRVSDPSSSSGQVFIETKKMIYLK